MQRSFGNFLQTEGQQQRMAEVLALESQARMLMQQFSETASADSKELNVGGGVHCSFGRGVLCVAGAAGKGGCWNMGQNSVFVATPYLSFCNLADVHSFKLTHTLLPPSLPQPCRLPPRPPVVSCGSARPAPHPTLG